MELASLRVKSPVGTLHIVGTPQGLCGLDFEEHRERLLARLELRFGSVRLNGGGSLEPAAKLLDAYFAGDLYALDRIEVDPGGSPFQRRVWSALRDVQSGQTASYGELACAIGRRGAARAVGAANACNPVAVVLPCHRIVASDGSLRGYAGGLERKRWLLQHEGGAE